MPPSRKSFFIFRIIATLVIAACLITGAAIMGVRWYNATPNQRLNHALTSIQASDAPVTQVDEALNTPLSAETTTQVKAALRAIVTARATLDRAQQELDAIPPATATATTTATRPSQLATRVAAARRSLAARRALLAAAPPLLNQTARAADALTSAARAWQDLQAGATLTTTASQQFAQQTQDALVASHASSTQAADAYARAHTQFTAAARTLPEADFSPYLAYTEQRILMTQNALLACEDWINGHYPDASADVAAYNSFAQSAARIAGADGLQLPSDLIAATYQQQTRVAQKTYDQARAEVLRADAALR